MLESFIQLKCQGHFKTWKTSVWLLSVIAPYNVKFADEIDADVGIATFTQWLSTTVYSKTCADKLLGHEARLAISLTITLYRS